MRTLSVTLLLLLVVCPSAQAQDTPLWRYTATEDMSFYRLTPLGDLAVATRDKLTALDAETGEEIWSRTDLADLHEESFNVIPLTPYGVVRSKDGIALIDLSSGTTLWGSTTILLKVRGYAAILPHEMLLLYGETAQSDKTLLAVDLETGAPRWRQDHLLTEKPRLWQLPVLDTDSTMIVFISEDGPLKLHTGTGELIWRVPDLVGREPPLSPMLLSDGTLFVSYTRKAGSLSPFGGDKEALVAIDPHDGRVLWDRETNTRSPIAQMQTVSLYDRFLADLTAKGFTVERSSEGWLVHSQQPIGNQVRQVILDRLDQVERLPNGLLVRSAPHREVGTVLLMLDVATGEPIWSAPTQILNTTSPFLVFENRVYLGTNQQFFALDLNVGAGASVTSMGEPFSVGTFEFRGCEAPGVLERQGAGLILRSEQNLVVLDTRGTMISEQYYRNGGCSLGQSLTKIAKAIAVPLAIVAFAGQVTAASVNQSFGAEPSDVDFTLPDFSWLNDLDQLAVKRFGASLETEQYAFMSDRDGAGHSVVKVRKADGEEIERLRLGKKSQDHLVDGISGTVFVKKDKREVLALRFP